MAEFPLQPNELAAFMQNFSSPLTPQTSLVLSNVNCFREVKQEDRNSPMTDNNIFPPPILNHIDSPFQRTIGNNWTVNYNEVNNNYGRLINGTNLYSKSGANSNAGFLMNDTVNQSYNPASLSLSGFSAINGQTQSLKPIGELWDSIKKENYSYFTPSLQTSFSNPFLASNYNSNEIYSSNYSVFPYQNKPNVMDLIQKEEGMPLNFGNHSFLESTSATALTMMPLSSKKNTKKWMPKVKPGRPRKGEGRPDLTMIEKKIFSNQPTTTRRCSLKPMYGMLQENKWKRTGEFTSKMRIRELFELLPEEIKFPDGRPRIKGRTFAHFRGKKATMLRKRLTALVQKVNPEAKQTLQNRIPDELVEQYAREAKEYLPYLRDLAICRTGNEKRKRTIFAYASLFPKQMASKAKKFRTFKSTKFAKQNYKRASDKMFQVKKSIRRLRV